MILFKRLCLSLLLTVISNQAFSADLADLFRNARKAAFQILQETPPSSIDYNYLKEKEFRGVVSDFYEEHYDELVEEARSDRVTIEIVMENKNGACGQTGKRKGSPISISRVSCFNKINSVGDGAKLLIGEYTHHMGKGDEFSDWIKTVVVKSWASRYPKSYEELFTPFISFEVDKDVDLSDIVTRVYFSTDSKRPKIFAFLQKGTVFFKPPKKLGKNVDLIMIANERVQWDEKNHRFYTRGVWNISGHESRLHWTGLYEKYPVWYQRKFNIYVQVLANGNAIKLTYEVPIRIDLAKDDVVMKEVSTSYIKDPGKEVINAYFNQ